MSATMLGRVHIAFATDVHEQRFDINPVLGQMMASSDDTVRPSSFFQSERFSVNHPINAVGLRGHGVIAEHDENIFFLHAFNASNTEVIVLPLAVMEGDLKEPLPNGTFATAPVIVPDSVVSLQLEIHTSVLSPSLKDMELIAFDTRLLSYGTSLQTLDNTAVEQPIVQPSPEIPPELPPDIPPADVNPLPTDGVTSTNPSATVAPSSDIRIVSRADWGADEAYRLTQDGNELWSAAYQQPEVFIVHHTAGGDGGSDPSAVVRAIYYWHAIVLGWGDVGYNYLIDAAGNIYEGREGGDGVIGGHTFNDQTGINYNEGSIGIALLGCFEESAGACGTLTIPTDAAKEALAQLIAAKMTQLQITPSDSVTFHGLTIARVVGHRDLDATYCPGSIVHNALAELQERVLAYYNGLIIPVWQGEFVQRAVQAIDAPSIVPVSTEMTMDIQKKYRISVTYRNTGNTTWKRKSVTMKIYNKFGQGTSLRHSSWKDFFGKIRMQEREVAPDQTATFTFRVRSPKNVSPKIIITRLVENNSSVSATRITHTLNFITIEGNIAAQ